MIDPTWMHPSKLKYELLTNNNTRLDTRKELAVAFKEKIEWDGQQTNVTFSLLMPFLNLDRWY